MTRNVNKNLSKPNVFTLDHCAYKATTIHKVPTNSSKAFQMAQYTLKVLYRFRISIGYLDFKQCIKWGKMYSVILHL